MRMPSLPKGGGTAVAVGGLLKSYLTIPQSPIGDSGRKYNLLPALAKNMPPAYFLDASRPLGQGSLSALRFGSPINHNLM